MGSCFGSQLRAKVSMMIMRPPQQGHGGSSMRLVGCRGVGRLGVFRAGRCGEQLAGAFDAAYAVTTGEQSLMADAVEALRQDVHQKTPDELVGRQRHRLMAGGP